MFSQVKNIFFKLSQLIFSSKRKRFLWGTVGLALCIRLAIIAFASDPEHPQMYEHGEIAHNLFSGHGFAMHWPYTTLDPERAALMKQPPQFEGAFLPPINPYIIYGTYLLFGENSTSIIFLMFFYSAISCFIPFAVFKTGMLIANERAARVSALISVFFLPGAYAVITFSGSPIYQLLGIIILYYTILGAKHPSLKTFVLLGIFCGVMTLLRSEFFMLGFILIGLSLFFARKKISAQTIIRRGIISFVLCAGIIAPWTYRNYMLFHTFIPVLSHPWFEMWRGNNIYATGTTLDEKGQPTWVTADKNPELIRRMDAIPYDQFFEAKVDGIFKDEVIKFIEENPGRFLFLGVKKIAFLFTIDFSHPTSRNPFYFGPMIIVSILTIVGLYKLIRQINPSNLPAATIFSLFFFFYLTLTVMTVMLPRYQIYIFTIGIVLTGVGINSKIPKFVTPRTKSLQYD